ncbi:MAG: coproporphyrinogen dehydrogenase HemZ [Turicibacter sp.]
MAQQIIMNILGVEEPLIINAMQVLNQSFFTSSIIDNEQSGELVFNYQETLDQDVLVIKGTLNNETQEIRRTVYEKDFIRARKYAYLATHLLLLQNHTKMVQSWGLLTGMRPTKLVHNMKKRGLTDSEIKAYMQDEYLVSDEKMDLLLNVANHQLTVIPDLHTIQNEISIYIGIPFCPTRCAYCTFPAYAHEPFKKWVEPFLDALIEEIKIVGAHIKKEKLPVTSIYFGGGTATTLSTSQFERLVSTVYKEIANASEVREITVEAGRPDTITKEKLALLRQYDIHRISINPQSFNQETLDRIGRHHSVGDVIDKYKLAKEYEFENINMDIIIGLPGEAVQEVAHTLKELSLLQPESLTVHMLAFKRSSKITQNRGLYTTANHEELTNMVEMTYEFAKNNDYIPYYLYRQKNISANMENIGYSKRGQESIYNILIMEEAQNILGLGVGASSKYLIGKSVHNPKDLKTYIDSYDAYGVKKIETLIESLEVGDTHAN